MSAAVLFLLACLGGSTGAGSACSCWIFQPDSAAARSEAVFLAQVNDVRPRALHRLIEYMPVEDPHLRNLLARLGGELVRYPAEYEADLRVLYSWKEPVVASTALHIKLGGFLRGLLGWPARTVKVRTPAPCFTSYFENGGYFLVYASRHALWPGDPPPSAPWKGEPLWTSYCSGTAPLDEARYDLLLLGQPANDYTLPADTLGLIDGTALAEREKREILAEAAEKIWHLSADVGQAGADGAFPL